jgi:hypothetical protein
MAVLVNRIEEEESRAGKEHSYMFLASDYW